MELTTLPALVIGAHTKTDIEHLALTVIEDCLKKGTPIELAEKIAATENLIKSVKSNTVFSNYLLDELAKEKGKHTTESGTKIEAVEAGVSYDYSSDRTWVELNNKSEHIKTYMKAREEILKKIPPGKLLVDADTGETLIGPAKKSTSSYKVTLSK